jgi:hypothetical protein
MKASFNNCANHIESTKQFVVLLTDKKIVNSTFLERPDRAIFLWGSALPSKNTDFGANILGSLRGLAADKFELLLLGREQQTLG